MIIHMARKLRFGIFAAVIAALIGVSASQQAQADNNRHRHHRDYWGGHWTWYDRDYGPYYRSYYRGRYWDDDWRHRRYRHYDYRGGGGVRVGPVHVWW